MSFSGPDGALQIFGVTLIGVTPENGRKLLLTVCFLVAAFLIKRLLSAALGKAVKGEGWPHVRFWARQAINILAALLVILAIVSIWFDDPGRLTTAIGLVTAGLAFAL